MIRFNIPPFIGTEYKYLEEAIGTNQKISGDGPFTKKCNSWLETNCNISKALLTTSCTHALEMAAILADIRPGDEVILPSYTFVSTANAFVSKGASLVYVDIRPDTMNIDENLIEDAITEKTKAIVPVHYAGIACNMDKITEIARARSLFIVEDAAQGMMSEYKGQALGAIGDFGCLSFHETKNFSMGEGGAILIKDIAYADRAEIIREKGTNRSKFIKGQVDKYTWVDVGSSYLPSDLNAAYLFAQLEAAEAIIKNRIETWNLYMGLLQPLENRGQIQLPTVPADCKHNAHMFYIKVTDQKEREHLIQFLIDRGILTVFHYIPLHSAPAGRIFGRFHGEDRFTTQESERLLRLPMYYNLEKNNVEYIVQQIYEFYRRR